MLCKRYRSFVGSYTSTLKVSCHNSIHCTQLNTSRAAKHNLWWSHSELRGLLVGNARVLGERSIQHSYQHKRRQFTTAKRSNFLHSPASGGTPGRLRKACRTKEKFAFLYKYNGQSSWAFYLRSRGCEQTLIKWIGLSSVFFLHTSTSSERLMKCHPLSAPEPSSARMCSMSAWKKHSER